MTKFQKLISMAILTLALPVAASAQAPSPEIAQAMQKYGIAQTLSKIAVKCSFAKDDLTAMGLNDVTIAVVDLSAKDYGDMLEAGGQSNFVSTTNAAIDTAMQTTICGRLPSDPGAQQYVQSASFLVNEVLYALSESGVSECGEVTQRLAPVIGEAKRIAASTASRPDLAAIKPLTEKRAARIKEMCDTTTMFGGDYLFMSQDPLGHVLTEMGKFMK